MSSSLEVLQQRLVLGGMEKGGPEEYEGDADGPPNKCLQPMREHLRPEPEAGSAVGRSSGTPPPHGVRLTRAGRGNTILPNVRTNQLHN